MGPVLLVDDSPVALQVLSATLRAAGFEVRCESSAAAALTPSTATLCCAVLDVELADGDGAELAAALRASHPSLPVAFFSGGAEGALLARVRKYGPVFAKPHVDDVVVWVKRVAQPPPTK